MGLPTLHETLLFEKAIFQDCSASKVMHRLRNYSLKTCLPKFSNHKHTQPVLLITIARIVPRLFALVHLCM